MLLNNLKTQAEQLAISKLYTELQNSFYTELKSYTGACVDISAYA